MHPADRPRAAVAGYPLEVLSDAITDALHMELVGSPPDGAVAARGVGRDEAPPLTDVPVDAILARWRGRVG